jgi:hypothetical protein
MKIYIFMKFLVPKSKKGFEIWTFLRHFKNVQNQESQILFEKKPFVTDFVTKMILSEIFCDDIFFRLKYCVFLCKHIKDKMASKKIAKKSQYKYACLKCDYYTSNKYDYEKHILTRKHLSTYNGLQLAYSENAIHFCDVCGIEYKHRQSLYRHKSKCLGNTKEESQTINNNSELKLTTNMFFELLKQNTEFKELIVEQNKQNQVLQTQLIELSKEKIIQNYNNTTSTNNSHNTTNNNNNFNLNLFLNETCKNAMNISEFLEQIPMKLSDLEDTARLGYAEGISRIFIRGLKELEVNERPIHCSDAKRETLYIKEGNTWEKDDTNKTKLTSAIKKVAHKNMCMIPQWKKEHPHCEQYDSNKNDLYLNIVSNSMCGGSEEETETNYNKIRKNIIKQVIIEK